MYVRSMLIMVDSVRDCHRVAGGAVPPTGGGQQGPFAPGPQCEGGPKRC